MRNGMTAQQRTEIVRLMEEAIPPLSANDVKFGIMDDAKSFVTEIRTALMERKVVTIDGIVEPRVGRVVILRNLPVDESRSWKKAVKAIDRGDEVEDLLKVESQFPPVKGGAERRRIVLVRGVADDEALRWARKQCLVPATPRALLAIPEHRSRIVRTLKQDCSNVEIITTLVPCVALLWGDRKKDKYSPYVRWIASGNGRQCEPVYNIGGGLVGGGTASEWIAFQDRDQ